MRKNITREQVISATLDLIELKQGRESLTIREISKSLGCSHPNIYNYYPSLDYLLWDVLEAVLERMMTFVWNKLKPEMSSDEKCRTFISNIVIFSLNNTCWYKLIWFDEIKGEIPPKTQEKVKIPSQKFVEFVVSLYPESADVGKAGRAASIIHSYMHGEISKYITHRNFQDERTVLTNRVTDNALLLLKMLINQPLER